MPLIALVVVCLLLPCNGLPWGILQKRSSLCESTDWRKQSLKLLKEAQFGGLFADTRGEQKFEASGMTFVNGSYMVVFDSHRSVGHIGERLELLSPDNYFIGPKGGDSQWEGMAYKPETGTFLVITETHEHGGHLKPLVEEIRLLPDHSGYDILQKCVMDRRLVHENKGIEGLQYHSGEEGELLLALCEGNHCAGGRKGRDKGNGRIQASRLHVASGSGALVGGHHNDTGCRWTVEKEVRVPPTAYFLDYSGMSISPGGRFGILSQEDAAIWVGSFDWNALEFTDEGEVFHFPRDNNCDQVWCNVEGMHWLDEQRIAVSSDRAKSSQPFVCTVHDQSLALFMLPIDG